MMRRFAQERLSKGFFIFTLSFCALLIGIAVFLSLAHAGNDLNSFTETVLSLSANWTLTDGAGASRAVSLPLTVEYGADGRYTLSRALPDIDGPLKSPVLRFYSNYLDVRVSVDGRELYAFPGETAAFSGATGNTYHFVRMPEDYAGKTLLVELRCQLGRDITYLINPPLLGSKATMLSRDVMRSLISFTLAGCMSILSVGLSVLYFAFRRRVGMSVSTLYTAVFSLLFAVYVYFETVFAQLLMPNGYLLCFLTLILLALVPIPLIGVFLDDVGRRFRPTMLGLMALCALNLIVQTALNFAGIMSVRAMLPATHVVLLLCIIVAALCLFFSDRSEKPGARRALLFAVPMILGGIADILLLNINRPSPNNCFYFACGVTFFIAQRMGGFIGGYFRLYRSSLETQLLSDMAYQDALSGIGNRNAYERKLKELGEAEPSGDLCCIVMDINDLKLTNDRLGHLAGDAAIAEVGSMLRALMPAGASYFRTGGDEFVVLLEQHDEAAAGALAQKLLEEADRRGAQRSIPIRLAVGFGRYDACDDGIIDFVSRIDTRMYECKRQQKGAGVK